MADATRLDELEAQAAELVFDAFDQLDAWRLGSTIAEAAIASGHAIAVDIRRPGFILFRASLPGSVPDQESWIAGKSAVALRLEASTALLEARFAAAGIDASVGWLPLPEYAIAGGSVPVRVKGVGVVATVTVSGLSSDDDHQIIVDAFRAHLLETGKRAG
jgi:uncharacterized protein (UPF0303 family)